MGGCSQFERPTQKLIGCHAIGCSGLGRYVTSYYGTGCSAHWSTISPPLRRKIGGCCSFQRCSRGLPDHCCCIRCLLWPTRYFLVSGRTGTRACRGGPRNIWRMARVLEPTARLYLVQSKTNATHQTRCSADGIVNLCTLDTFVLWTESSWKSLSIRRGDFKSEKEGRGYVPPGAHDTIAARQIFATSNVFHGNDREGYGVVPHIINKMSMQQERKSQDSFFRGINGCQQLPCAGSRTLDTYWYKKAVAA